MRPWSGPRPAFDVRVHGQPIIDAPVKGAVRPGITYAASFAEWEAATAAGVDLWRWETGGYPPAFKARVLAWHLLHRLVDLHGESAAIEAARKKAGRK